MVKRDGSEEAFHPRYIGNRCFLLSSCFFVEVLALSNESQKGKNECVVVASFNTEKYTQQLDTIEEQARYVLFVWSFFSFSSSQVLNFQTAIIFSNTLNCLALWFSLCFGSLVHWMAERKSRRGSTCFFLFSADDRTLHHTLSLFLVGGEMPNKTRENIHNKKQW